MRETAFLKGTIEIQGSKNTVLPIIAATILTNGISVIHNCPDIRDVHVMCELLHCLNITTCYAEHVLTINTEQACYAPLPYTLTCKLRSSVLMLGPMLARWGRAELGMPGGCAIGTRPIDIHLEGLNKMNVDIQMDHDVLSCSTFYLQGCEFHLRYPSVGATENLLMAAAGAKGRTILRGAAKEPEIVELCNYLLSIGVLIEGVGTDVLVIKGSRYLVCADYVNVYDRIVAGTYLLMAAAIPCDLVLTGIDDIHYIKNIIRACARLGVNVIRLDSCLRVQGSGHVTAGDYVTGIYPEFPTDLQPMLITALTRAEGKSTVLETVFENRFSIVEELTKLNGDLYVDGNRVVIHGERREKQCDMFGGAACLRPCRLIGHTVRATDLRQGAALVFAGMLAKGYTTITDVTYIERGYEDIIRDLRGVGVEISYV